MIEVFPGTEYKNKNVCPVNRETRLDKEVCWKKSLRTSYAYGLNKRKMNFDPNSPVGSSFPPFPRSKQRCVKYRHNVNFDNLKSMESIFNYIQNYITDDIENAFYHIQILLNKTRKKYF